MISSSRRCSISWTRSGPAPSGNEAEKPAGAGDKTSRKTSPASKDHPIALAKKFLEVELGIAWTKDGDQDSEKQMPLSGGSWGKVPGNLIYGDKNPVAENGSYILVTLSKDRQKYNEDYLLLIDPAKKRVIAAKKRKWDG